MNMVFYLLIALSGILCILGQEMHRQRMIYFFKPLTMILIMALMGCDTEQWNFYAWLILAGLLISTLGDIFLMLPDDRFLEGLLSFLIAHFFYLGAFYIRGGVSVTPEFLIPLLVYTLAMMVMILPRAGSLKIPVAFYVTVLFLMGWQAVELWHFPGNSGTFTCMGGLLFVISDSALGWNRFRGAFPLSSSLVLGTYFPAQLFLALSV